MRFCIHWWKRLTGIDNWGVRKCRWCNKREVARYNKETSTIEWIIVNG